MVQVVGFTKYFKHRKYLFLISKLLIQNFKILTYTSVLKNKGLFKYINAQKLKDKCYK